MAQPDWLTARPVAHRGYHDAGAGRMENTLPAVSAAIDHDFAVEVDVRLTADRRPIIFHDNTLDRLTTSRGNVDQLTLADLQKVRFREGDARIPTLDELLDLVGGRTPLFLELKADWSRDGHLIRIVSDALSAYEGAVAVASFDHLLIAAFRRLNPGIPRGLIAGRSEPSYWPADRPLWRWLAYRHLIFTPFSRPDFISYRVTSLPASAPLALRHFLRMPLLAYTVNSAQKRTVAAEWTDQIIFEDFDPDDPAAAKGA
jgi:glycerophosphoryl diester phosphodiesterase